MVKSVQINIFLHFAVDKLRGKACISVIVYYCDRVQTGIINSTFRFYFLLYCI